ncbi:MAG: ferredoxin family protein [Verrucomicrobiota bacterium]
MKPKKTVLVLCRCASSENALADKRQQILEALLAAKAKVHVVDDLCELSARKDARLAAWMAGDEVKIVACYPRTVKALLKSAGCALNGEAIAVLNPRADSAESIVQQILAEGLGEPASVDFETPKGSGWIPWFPVIDTERCVNCKQCLSFCLFGVYGLDEDGRVAVLNPQGCKTNCPACARICPEVAIIFPKYSDASASASPISGAPIQDETTERARVKVDVKQILGSDVYGALAERRKRARPHLIKQSGITLGQQASNPPVPPSKGALGA